MGYTNFYKLIFLNTDNADWTDSHRCTHFFISDYPLNQCSQRSIFILIAKLLCTESTLSDGR